MACHSRSFSLSFCLSLSFNTGRHADNEADAFIERNHRIIGFESAKARDVQNLQNWVDGNGCVAREETAYLQRSEELLTLSYAYDSAVIWSETLVEDNIVRLRGCFGWVRSPQSLSLCRR